LYSRGATLVALASRTGKGESRFACGNGQTRRALRNPAVRTFRTRLRGALPRVSLHRAPTVPGSLLLSDGVLSSSATTIFF